MKIYLSLLLFLCFSACLCRVKKAHAKRSKRFRKDGGVEFNKAKATEALAKTEGIADAAKCAAALIGYLEGTLDPKNPQNFWALAKGDCKGNIMGAVSLFLIGGIDPNGEYIPASNYPKISTISQNFYLPLSEVPYHSYIHGADLAFKAVQYMESKSSEKKTSLKDYFGFSKIEYLSMILGGIAHDWGHPGDNNGNERNLGGPITKHYGGILENLSCDLALLAFVGEANIKILGADKYLFFKEMSSIQATDYPYSPTVEPQVYDEAIKVRSNFAFHNIANAENRKGIFNIVLKNEKELSTATDEQIAQNKEKLKTITTIATIMRYSIYSTNMSPFDARIKHALGKLEDADWTELTSQSTFNYEAFIKKEENLLLKNRVYYEKDFNPDNNEPAGDKDTMADFPINKKHLPVPGMANLDDIDINLNAKGFIAGVITHVSDIGNAYQGIEGYKPWFRYLMYEWGQMKCAGKFTFYGIDQGGFQLFGVEPTVKEASKLAPTFYFDQIVADKSPFESIGGSLKYPKKEDKKTPVDPNQENDLTPDFKAVDSELKKLTENFNEASCGVNFGSLEDFSSIEGAPKVQQVQEKKKENDQQKSKSKRSKISKKKQLRRKSRLSNRRKE